MEPLPKHQTGIVGSKESGVVILLPPGPIRSQVQGESGHIYYQTLVDDPSLGRPVAQLTIGKDSGDIYNHQ
jgi:hypothetical protein